MHEFLNIITSFSQPDERNLKYLETVYNDSSQMNSIILKAIATFPLDAYIKKKKVLLKPNWVTHSKKYSDELCLRTNDKFVIAVLRVILSLGPVSVTIGDAPIQGCKWDKMISRPFKKIIQELSDEFKIPVEIKDFRRRTYIFHDNNYVSDIRPISDYLIFDVGKGSFLEPVTKAGQTKFRVTNYDPERMSEAHASGIHKYCITKEFFDADVVISLPKIKTHQKTGITGALKNIVGINGDKDFLPHHRLGGTKMDGDCYPGGSYLRYWSELSIDKANRRQGRKSFWYWQKLSSLLWKLSFPGPLHNQAAGWYGNDTTWRMVMDLNRIALYGYRDGKLYEKPQRQIFSLCDGIIAGQGDGPLDPEPLALGIISFTDNSVLNDRAMALLMELPLDKIPLLATNGLYEELDYEITINGEGIKLKDLNKYAIKATSPKGWTQYLNNIK